MKKQLITLGLSAVLAAALSVPALAGMWVLDKETGLWHYDYYGRGVAEGFIRGQWAWIDGNYDGVSEYYCFDADGNMLADTSIEAEDGTVRTVNELGQWTVDGIVQEKKEGVADTSGKTAYDLTAAEPQEINFGERFETAETATGQVFEQGFCLHGDLSHASYLVFDLSGIENPETMTLTFAPKAGQDQVNADARVSVTGLTTGKSLYRSEKFRPNHAPVSVTFNVRNESSVRIAVVRGFDVLIDTVEVR